MCVTGGGGGGGGVCVCVCGAVPDSVCPGAVRVSECRWPKPHSDGQIKTSLVSHTILACHEES